MESNLLGPLVKGASEPESADLKAGSDAAASAEARRRADRFLLLSDAGRELMALRAVPEVCDTLYTQAKRLIDCNVFYIGLYSHERQEVDVVLKMDAGITYSLRSVRAVETLILRAITSKQPFTRHASSGDLASLVGQDAPGPRSALFVPMIVGDRALGALSAHSFNERAYDQDDIAVVQALASQAAVAIENARAFEQTRAWALALEAMQTAGVDLQQCETAGELGTATASALRPLLPLDTCRIMLVEDRTRDLVTLAYCGPAGEDVGGGPADNARLPKGEGPFGSCADRDEPVVTNDGKVGTRNADTTAAGPLEQSILAVPLRHNRSVIGVLGLTKRGYNKYHPDNVRLAQVLADHVALAITNMLVVERANHRLNRLNELDQVRKEFVTSAEHELRAPLTSIVGFTELLLHFWDRLTLHRQKEMVHRIHTSATRLQRLLDDALSATRMEGTTMSITLEPVDLASQIRQAIVEITTKYRGRVVVQEPPKEAVSIHADAHRVQQVMVNLLDNAAKYSSEGSPITVRWHKAGELAEVSIADSGQGIAEEERAVLFDQFGKSPQSERSGQSRTGLGLYIARQLVEAMGGTIWLDTGPGQGSTFSFCLPLAHEQCTAPHASNLSV